MAQRREDEQPRERHQQTAPEEQQQQQRDPWNGPGPDGLYDPRLEKEACGVGFIVAIDGKRTNKVRRVWGGQSSADGPNSPSANQPAGNAHTRPVHAAKIVLRLAHGRLYHAPA